ncbi:hypothetical protein BJ742DRAFT_856227 [Cladochytrium replicatum]|nr:hypothetical protein BJ742DRAFT_856227 [Cladochytrium replicatum]
MSISLRTWSLIQAVLEILPISGSISAYLKSAPADAAATLAIEANNALMSCFAVVPGLYLYLTNASEEATTGYISGCIAYNFVVPALVLRRLALGVKGSSSAPALSIFVLHFALGVAQVRALAAKK